MEYLVEAPTIKISGFLDGTGDMISMEIGIPPKFAPGFHPESRTRTPAG